MGQEDFLSLLAYGFPSSPPPAGPSPQEHTCRSYSSEVVGPAQHHAGPVAGALDQRPGQGGEQEDHGQVQHRHEEGEVEALYGVQSTAGRPGAVRQQPSLGSPPPAPGAGALIRCLLRALQGFSPTVQSLGIRDLVPIWRSHRQQVDKWGSTVAQCYLHLQQPVSYLLQPLPMAHTQGTAAWARVAMPAIRVLNYFSTRWSTAVA